MGIEIRNDYGWTWMENFQAEENRRLINEEIYKKNHGRIGKYLFFSDDRNALLNLGEVILKEYNLSKAKVSQKAREDVLKKGNLYFVLCVFDVAEDMESGGKLLNELSKYADWNKIYYRKWKYDKTTLQQAAQIS